MATGSERRPLGEERPALIIGAPLIGGVLFLYVRNQARWVAAAALRLSPWKRPLTVSAISHFPLLGARCLLHRMN